LPSFIGYSFRDYDALTGLLKARQENEDLKLLILSPDSHDIRKMLDDEEWFLWTESIHGYFGNPECEVKYLQEVNNWLSRQLKSQKDNSATIKPDSTTKKFPQKKSRR